MITNKNSLGDKGGYSSEESEEEEKIPTYLGLFLQNSNFLKNILLNSAREIVKLDRCSKNQNYLENLQELLSSKISGKIGGMSLVEDLHVTLLYCNKNQEKTEHPIYK